MQIIFNDQKFDHIVHSSLPEADERHQAIICKGQGTTEGNPVCCITQVGFVGQQPYRFQMVVTVRQFLAAAAAMSGRYAHLNLTDRVPLPKDAPKTISDQYKGVGWDAIQMKEVYLIKVEGNFPLQGVGGSEREARAVAEALIDQLIQLEERNDSDVG